MWDFCCFYYLKAKGFRDCTEGMIREHCWNRFISADMGRTLDSSREMQVGELKGRWKIMKTKSCLFTASEVKNSKLWMSNQRHVMSDFMASYLLVLTVPSLCVPGDCRKSQCAKCPRLWALPLKPCWHAAPLSEQSAALYALIMASIRVNISTDPSYKHITPTPL